MDPQAGDRVEIPLFPLNTVLFPGGFLPLRIFEPRYLDMVSHCLQQQSPFGVVLIRDGRETGPAAEPCDIGTLAIIVDFDKTKDGMLMIACMGGDRFRVLNRVVASSQMQRAEVEMLWPGEDSVLPHEYRPLANFLRAVVNQPGISRRIAPPDIDYSSPREVGYRIAELLPVTPREQQRLLEIDDPVVRLAAIESLLRGMEFTLEA